MTEKRLSSENGMALLMVLGVLAATMLLIAHMMLITQVLSKEAYMVARKGLLRYQAESAADTAFWMHLTDRRLFSDRKLGQTADNSSREDADFPPWMLDGRPHEFDDGLCYVYLASGENGTRAGKFDALKTGLDASDDADIIQEIDEFNDAYKDYVDADDLIQLNGYEADDYIAAGFPTLPRNGEMEFRAELYWLPNWQNVLTQEISIIPPPGISYNFGNNAKPSFFSATEEQLCQYLDIDPGSAELAEVLQALKEWHENGTPLEETLDLDLLTKVENNFNFTEAGLAIVNARAYDPAREIHAGYRVTREAKISSRSFFADSARECLSIWERRWE